MSTRLRSWIVFLAFGACICSTSARVSGYWQSSVELAQAFAQVAPALNEKGFTVFVVRHGSRPKYPLSSVVADMRRSVRFIHQHAKEYGVDPNRLGVFGNSSGGHLALLLGMTGDSGNPSASDPVLRESNRVAAVVANYPATDLARLAKQHPFLNITAAEAAEFSPVRFVSPSQLPRSSCTATPTRSPRSIMRRRCTRR